jgi:GNAT superfamily N-acetyltransferase
MHQARRAAPCDIDHLMVIRGAVHENRLSDPLSVTRADYERFVGDGRVWVVQIGDAIVGFSASDADDGTIWALFVDPACQGTGIGTLLLDKACLDLAADGHRTARLTTDPGTAAERLYRKLGWTDLGIAQDGEVRFERAL